MSKVLQRSMFNTPKHEHKSTGIASGLEYRPGYKVGGRVGFEHGGSHLFGGMSDFERKKEEERLSNINPNLSISERYDQFRSPFEESGLGKFLAKPSLQEVNTAYREATKKYDDEILRIRDKIKDDPYYVEKMNRSVLKQESPPTEKEGYTGSDSMSIPVKKTQITNKEDAKNLYDDFFRTDALINKNREELDVELQKLRNEEDLKSKKLAEKFNKATKTESILAGLAAANDPNLKKGQSRVASGVSAFAERAAVGKRERLDRAEKDQATKFLRAESDLATKFSRVEDDIKREKDLKDYGHKLSLAKKYDPDQTAALQEINYLLDQFGVESGSKQHETIAINRILGNPLKEKDYSDLRNTIAEKMQEINATGSPNEYRRLIGIPERFDINGEEVDLDVQDRLLAEQMMISGATLEERQKEANGGRVGYAIGGQVTKETLAPEEVAAVSNELNNNEVPLIMNYSQLRKRLPEFIDDEIVSLIAHSPNAFKDFAIIDNQADVEEFNEKYDVRLELPDADRMDFTDAEKTTSAPMPVTVPSAVAADPNIMPMQRGTGQLTPTEVALLSPMEQAIKMRSG